jgi:Dullard-like phosphatase family protein
MKSVQELLEERAKYFIKNQPQNNVTKRNLNRVKYYESFSTLKDPFSIQIDNLKLLFNNHKKIPTNYNDNLNTNGEKLSTLFTQIIKNGDIPLKESVSFQVSKELSKYAEPNFKRKEFLKLPQKFTINDENETKSEDKTSKHKYTNSELELIETDEKVPQNKIKEIENNINQTKKIEDIFNSNDILCIFHYLSNIEKCYQEFLNDLKGNGFGNIDYKLNIGCTYLKIITDEKNLIGDIFLNEEDDINTFLIRELCLYLTILFFDDFAKGLTNNQIEELFTLQNYCHINLLHIIMMVISKIEYYFSESKIKFEENSIEFNDFQNCKVLIEINSDKINFKKYKESFHINNKIIKNIFLNFLSILKDINANISQNILEIFNLSKKSKFKTIINDHIKNNSLIYNKINEVIRNDNSPENANYIYNNHMNGNPQLNGNCIKRDIPIPFLPPKREDDNREYTLVLDLDETLVHFFEDNNEAYVKVRMGAECFISILSQFCEIVIFTASTKFYADTVIDGLDCKDLINHKLYREHTYDYNGINVKDLSKLGRDLNKVIIIDNIEENYMFQPNNGLNIIDFEGDENDNELHFILEDLLKVVTVPGKNIIYELPEIRKNMQKRYCNIE